MMVRRVAWALVAVGVAAGLFSAARRVSVEAKNRAVEIAVDLHEVREIAAAEGLSPRVVLERFRDAGATSVIVAEDTLGSLERQRRLEVVPTTRKEYTYLFFHQGLFARVRDHLRHRTRLGISLPPNFEDKTPNEAGIDAQVPWSILEPIGVGIDPDAVELAHSAGLDVVGRAGNNPSLGPEGIAWTLQQLQAQGVRTVLFSGDDVLGFPKRLGATADALKGIGLNYGTVEFGKQKGDAGLARLAAERVVRVHTILTTEMQAMTPPDAVQRLSLAIRERNIRLLFVRLFRDEPEPFAANVAFLEGIGRSARAAGLTTAPAHPFEPLTTPLWLRALIGLGVAGGLALLFDAIAGVRSLSGTAAVAVVVAGVAALPLAPGARLVALLAACVFPALALLRQDLRGPRVAAAPLPRTLAECVGVTLAGVVLMVGLLADRLFLVKADAFLGVKATLMVPVALVALVYGLELRSESPRALAQRVRDLWAAGRRLLNQPILVWQVLAAAIALGLALMMWLRSDNDPGIGVSAFELKLRVLLDRLLFVRPRFKDIFFHPALLLGIALGRWKARPAATVLIILGAIGQTSLLNAFCHLHTPLYISALRALVGLALGMGIGGALWWLLARLPLARHGR